MVARIAPVDGRFSVDGWAKTGLAIALRADLCAVGAHRFPTGVESWIDSKGVVAGRRVFNIRTDDSVNCTSSG